jgi:asparagine synthase (glutamine-hydrolysing)
VAEASGQTHQILPMGGKDFFKEFTVLAAKSVYLSDGTMDVTGAAELYMNRLAREIAPVRLTGNYGSEILRQHVAFRPGKQAVPGLHASVTALLPQAAETYAGETRGNRLSFIAFKQVPWHHYARSSVERSQLMVRSPFLDNDLVSLAFQAPPEATGDLDILLRLVSKGAPALGKIPTDRGLTWPSGSLINRIKRSYHEFMAKAEYAYDYGMPQKLARFDHAFSALHLERLFLGRQKFCHFRVWYRDHLAAALKEVLLDHRSSSRWFFDHSVLEKTVNSHVNGKTNHTIGLHKLLSLELLCRGLIDPDCSLAS